MQTVLAIDDSLDTHHLLAARLRHEQILVHHAMTAEDGLVKARMLQPDLILLDIDIPDITGFELCKMLKADPTTSPIPIIFLTATTTTFVKVEGFELGAVDFVTKPFEGAELRARVRSALRTKRYHDMLAWRAHIDALTGLWNRTYFDQRLREEIAAAHRYRRSVCLALIDLERLKQINDTHGHPAGDRILMSVGELLSGSARATDAACRHGGDEFSVIMTETSFDNGCIAAERLCGRIRGLQIEAGEHRLHVTASIGVAATDELGELSPAGLIAAADSALYAAKQAGGNRVYRASTRHGETRPLVWPVQPMSGQSSTPEVSDQPRPDEFAEGTSIRW